VAKINHDRDSAFLSSQHANAYLQLVISTADRATDRKRCGVWLCMALGRHEKTALWVLKRALRMALGEGASKNCDELILVVRLAWMDGIQIFAPRMAYDVGSANSFSNSD
jgi:hypothetical protein